jgi:nucleoside-diphosphate-sugar epimerase
MSDTIDGFLAAGLCPGLEGETIHLGTGRSESIEEVFVTACEVCGVEARVEEDPARVRPRQSEVMVLQSDPIRARQRLGWEAKISLRQGLAETAEWLKANLDRYRPEAYAV